MESSVAEPVEPPAASPVEPPAAGKVEPPAAVPVMHFGWPGAISEHLPLIAAALSTLFISLRILAVAKFDSATAYAILQSGGTAAVIFGAMLSLIGQLAVLLSVACLSLYSLIPKDQNQFFKNLILAGGVGFFLISLWTGSLLNVATLLVIIGSNFAVDIRRWFKFRKYDAIIARDNLDELRSASAELEIWRGKLRKQLDRSSRVAQMAFAVLMTLLAIMLVGVSIDTTPWLPAERLTIMNSRSMTGYVLDESLTTVVLLTADNRQVIYLDANLVLGRRICSEAKSPLWLESLPQLISAPRYPACSR